MFRQISKRSYRELTSRRAFATSRQKRALNEKQLGKEAEGPAKPSADAKPDPPAGGAPPSSGGGSSLVLGLGLVAAGGAGAYYMGMIPADMLPGFLSSAPETPAPVTKKEKPKKEEAPAAAKPEPKKEVAKKEVVKKEPATAEKAVSVEPATPTGNRVMNIALPEGSTRSAPPTAVTEHPFGGNRVSMNPAKGEDPSKENAPSVDAALKELQRQISKDDSTRSLIDAHKDLANLASMDLSDLDEMSLTQLKIRLVQMAKDLEERTKWEAVRLKEFLAMKEKEVEDKYTLVLKKQEREAESLLDQRMREQKDKLVRQADQALKEKEETLQAIIDNSLKVQEQAYFDEKSNFEKMTEERVDAKFEELYGKSLAEAKADFSKRMEQKVQQIETLGKKLSDLEFALQSSKDYKSGSVQAHRMSAAALALIDKLESSKPAGAAVEALKSVADTNPVVNSAIGALPDSVASSGVATLQELQTQFEEQVHPKCRQAAFVPEGQSGVEGQLLGMLFAKLKFEPGHEDTAPESEKDSAEYVLSRARRHVQLGELEQAVVQMDKLQGQASFTGRDWQKDAKDRVAVEKALKVIRMECALANELMGEAN